MVHGGGDGAGEDYVDEGEYDPDAEFFRGQGASIRYEVREFLAQCATQGAVEWYQKRDGKNAQYQSPQPPFSRAVNYAVHHTNPHFQSLYSHQVAALHELRNGRDILLSTQTASGKTLCYNPAILERVCASREPANAPRALYIFPLNALIEDQYLKLQQLRGALAQKGVGLDVDRLKRGQTKIEKEEIARRCPHVLCVNPELLQGVLNYGSQTWQPFLSRLEYVVIDEVHTYRGILGIHMAGILRRLRLAVMRYRGTVPQFILCSATIGNPEQMATRLTGNPAGAFTILGDEIDGSAQADKHWAVVSPELGWSGDNNAGYLSAAATALAMLLQARNSKGAHSPLQTILFVRAIKDTYRVREMVQQRLRDAGHPELAAAVDVFIGSALTHSQKQRVYERLRDRRCLGVISTSALEAGVDIGSMDACVLAGYQGSIMSMRQMAGRCGRRDEGVVVYVPRNRGPLDQFYRDYPALLLTQPPEAFVVDHENPYILKKHVNAAARELGRLSPFEAEFFGSHIDDILQQGEKEGVLSRDHRGRIKGTYRDYRSLNDPWAIQGIRGNTPTMYLVCDADHAGDCSMGEKCFTGDEGACAGLIARLDRPLIYRDCHPGAIYEHHSGNLYRVTLIEESNKRVLAEKMTQGTYRRTAVDMSTHVEILDEPEDTTPLENGAAVSWGRVQVTRRFEGFFEYDLVPVRRCRRCRVEVDLEHRRCPKCNRRTELHRTRSKPVPRDFPEPSPPSLRLDLVTVGSWLTVPFQAEAALIEASHCPYGSLRNGLKEFLGKKLNPRRPMSTQLGLGLSDDERQALGDYHKRWSQGYRPDESNRSHSVPIFPGIYGQCLVRHLRNAAVAPERVQEIHGAVMSKGADSADTKVCLACWRSNLHAALHTVEHAVVLRYPFVADGDSDDLGSYTTLAHETTEQPTVFWYDNLEGGHGAAEKVHELYRNLAPAALQVLRSCTCDAMEGCPICAQLGYCEHSNEGLSRAAGAMLFAMTLGLAEELEFRFSGSRRSRSQQRREVHEREYSRSHPRSPPHDQGAAAGRPPNEILRLQQRVHEPVLRTAFEVRGAEIATDLPPTTAEELYLAYQQLTQGGLEKEWRLSDDMSAHEVLEVLETASPRMIRSIYRALARVLHPDLNPERTEWANEMQKIVNRAYTELKLQ